MSKRPRTLDSFFAPNAAKKPKPTSEGASDTTVLHQTFSKHPAYPHAVLELPSELRDLLGFVPATEGRVIKDQPDLDLLYFSPFVPQDAVRDLFLFLRRELFFYRVRYNIKRGSIETQVNTPRFTTVFGVDDTARFGNDGSLVDVVSGHTVPNTTYKQQPRPIPSCLDALLKLTEAATGCTFNFALVNYYASGEDSISYHSDDERFLGVDPAIASFSLGAKRDFLLKHKPTPHKHESESKPTKLNLKSGDMILMRGKTQSNWLHSIPKRKGGDADKGRINITFRKAMIKAGTDNYYRYNVGDGGTYKWSDGRREMLPMPESPNYRHPANTSLGDSF